MYAHPQNGKAAATTAAPASNAHYVGTLRRNILAAIIGNAVFTEAEQLRANHSVYECQQPGRLALWLKNTRRVAREREQALALARFAEGLERGKELVSQGAALPQWATPAQCDEIFALASLPCFTAGEKTGAMRRLPTLTHAKAIAEIGSLYATAIRRGARVSPFSDGSTQPVIR